MDAPVPFQTPAERLDRAPASQSAQLKPPSVSDEVGTIRKPAKSGTAKAQHDLGMLYLSGRNVPKDPAQTATWFEKAAIQRLTNVQFNFSVLYQRGEGVTQNDRLAFS